MTVRNEGFPERGKVEGTIYLDTGKKETLSKLEQLEDELNDLADKLSELEDRQSELAKNLSKKLAQSINELKQDALNKLREEESMLADLRKTLAKVDSKQDRQTGKQDEILRTAKKLQAEFVFEEKIAPGVREIIKARDNVIGQLNDSEEADDDYIFYEALDQALEDTLEEFNVTEVEPEGGSQFNPEVQEVVSEESTLQSKDDGKVNEILKPGYRWKDRLIRPQQVKITKFKGGTNE